MQLHAGLLNLLLSVCESGWESLIHHVHQWRCVPGECVSLLLAPFIDMLVLSSSPINTSSTLQMTQLCRLITNHNQPAFRDEVKFHTGLKHYKDQRNCHRLQQINKLLSNLYWWRVSGDDAVLKMYEPESVGGSALGRNITCIAAALLSGEAEETLIHDKPLQLCHSKCYVRFVSLILQLHFKA